MSKSTFAKMVINQLKAAVGTDGGNYNASTATTAMSAIATAISNYLIANTTVTVTYIGTIPGTPPAPDPIVTDTFKIIGACSPPGPVQSFDVWIKQIEANIIAGFKLAPMGTAGVTFAAAPFLSPGILTSQSLLKSLHKPDDEDPQQKIWEAICGGIMDWINTTAINPAPGVASRATGPSTGSANIVKISIT